MQIVIALIITPDGLPVGYEVMRGNTSDKTMLRDMLEKIAGRYGKEQRTWIMDRGIPTEEAYWSASARSRCLTCPSRSPTAARYG